MARFDFLGGNHFPVGEQLEQRACPPFVVTALVVVGQRLSCCAAHVEVPCARRAERQRHRQHTWFPIRMPQLAFGLRHDGALHLPAADVGVTDVIVGHVDAATPARPVPIIESRVTKSAKDSSSMPSVPSGRIGTTRYRTSAVESHTRISVSGSNTSPNSASTPRGSRTARARYGALLYQLGGSPRTAHG